MLDLQSSISNKYLEFKLIYIDGIFHSLFHNKIYGKTVSCQNTFIFLIISCPKSIDANIFLIATIAQPHVKKNK